MRLSLVLCIWTAGLATPATAGQPYSQSLAQCAALYDLSNRIDPSRRSGEQGRALTRLRDAFYAEAVRQAGREGGDRASKERVAAYYETAAATWDSRGLLFVLSDEARDWFDYCRTFGAHLGVVTPS